MDAFIGAIREVRTLDPMIKSHVLYQLSYNRILTIFAPVSSSHLPFRLYFPASPVSFFSSFKYQSYYLKSYDLTTRQFDLFSHAAA